MKRIALLVWSLVFCSALFAATPVFAQADMLNIQQAQIVNAPDVRNWPVTTALTEVSFDGSVTRVNFTKRDGAGRWPDVTPPGWSGPLEYTLWLFVNNNGQWVGSGFIQFWNGRDGSGTASDPDVPSRYATNWYYSQRWAPVFGHGAIQQGEQIGFMVTSGNQRDSVGPNSVAERSNVVVFAATDNGRYTFAAAQPPVVVTPPNTPPVVTLPGPAPLPSVDLSGVVTQAAVNHASEMAELAELKTQVALIRQDIAEFRQAVKSRYESIVTSPIFKYAIAAVSGILLTKAAQ